MLWTCIVCCSFFIVLILYLIALWSKTSVLHVAQKVQGHFIVNMGPHPFVDDSMGADWSVPGEEEPGEEEPSSKRAKETPASPFGKSKTLSPKKRLPMIGCMFGDGSLLFEFWKQTCVTGLRLGGWQGQFDLGLVAYMLSLFVFARGAVSASATFYELLSAFLVGVHANSSLSLTAISQLHLGLTGGNRKSVTPCDGQLIGQPPTGIGTSLWPHH